MGIITAAGAFRASGSPETDGRTPQEPDGNTCMWPSTTRQLEIPNIYPIPEYTTEQCGGFTQL